MEVAMTSLVGGLGRELETDACWEKETHDIYHNHNDTVATLTNTCRRIHEQLLQMLLT